MAGGGAGIGGAADASEMRPYHRRRPGRAPYNAEGGGGRRLKPCGYGGKQHEHADGAAWLQWRG
jgi:hypothetical protein